LAEFDLDGWLLYDFRRTNDLACQVLEIPAHKLLTRRFFYWIPRNGTPIKIVHRIEEQSLAHLPGNTRPYATWQELDFELRNAVQGSLKVAMEYSPRNAIPYISKVDAGTVEMIRSLGVEVVSSANLLQKFTSVWNKSQWQAHLEAADVLDETVSLAWIYISEALQAKQAITEYDVQQFIIKQLQHNGCLTDDPPICAINEHSANPHYVPTQNDCSVIKPNDWILLDLWGKRNIPDAVYADITRVGVASPHPSQKQHQIFTIVKEARDKATDFVSKSVQAKRKIYGWEVDQVCRDVIHQAGYSQYFTHRTGHSIDLKDHGSGANIDNYETHDDRELIPGTCFSIEPGIYLPGEFGVRLEYDVYITHEGTIQVTGGIQDAITVLKAQS